MSQRHVEDIGIYKDKSKGGRGVSAGWHRHSYLARQLHVACGYTLPSGLASRKRKSQKPGLELQLQSSALVHSEQWHNGAPNANIMKYLEIHNIQDINLLYTIINKF